jgi:hypothetical protein
MLNWDKSKQLRFHCLHSMPLGIISKQYRGQQLYDLLGVELLQCLWRHHMQQLLLEPVSLWPNRLLALLSRIIPG